MRFTEHELTLALHGAAKTVLAGRKDVRKKKLDVDDVWRTMDKFERYQLLDGLGGQLIPVLVALPDVEVQAGTRATFTQEQVTEAVESVVGDSGGKLRRKASVVLTAALVTAALQHLPIRRDPDGVTSADGSDSDEIVVPDSLEGLEGFN